MTRLSLPPLALRRTGRLRPMVVVRIALAAVAVCLAIAPALSAEKLRLRAEVTAAADVLTLADLAEGAPATLASTPLFRAPALGEAGTIQARRIVEAATRLGFALETGGRGQVVVTRAARRIEAAEIEAAVKQALEARAAVDPRAVSLVFDGASTLLVPPDAKEPASAEDVAYDRRTRRVSATVRVGERGALRVAGVVVDVVEVAVLNRALNRGDTVHSADLAIERRAREAVPTDLQADAASLAGRVARRNLAAGTIVRVGDLGKPELVSRGDIVTVVYEIPGLTLTLRARASESGTEGDTVAVVNPQSKKTLQATVVAAGRVSVATAGPARVAANAPSSSTTAR